MDRSELSTLTAQTQQPPTSDPLINKSGEHLIYIGLGGMAILVTLIIGFFSRRFDVAIVFSLLLSAIIIVLIMVA